MQAPSNLTGICDHSIQPKIDAALAGTESIADVLGELEPKLWAMETVLPILQDTTIVTAGPTVQNVSLTGAVPVGIVGDAGKWVKVPCSAPGAIIGSERLRVAEKSSLEFGSDWRPHCVCAGGLSPQLVWQFRLKAFRQIALSVAL